MFHEDEKAGQCELSRSLNSLEAVRGLLVASVLVTRLAYPVASPSPLLLGGMRR
jgi:hypothetical protein